MHTGKPTVRFSTLSDYAASLWLYNGVIFHRSIWNNLIGVCEWLYTMFSKCDDMEW